jgi:hypothetical protein
MKEEGERRKEVGGLGRRRVRKDAEGRGEGMTRVEDEEGGRRRWREELGRG